MQQGEFHRKHRKIMAKVKCPKCFYVNPDGQEQCVQCGAFLPRIRIDAQPSPRPAGEGGGGAPELQFRRGQVVAERYSVLNLIGRGGMGAIYKVHDNVLGETVALKTLLPQFVRDKMVVERFFNEAKIARRLAHPNIVRVHDIGQSQGSVYISMEYVQGISLRAMLEGMPAGQRLQINKVLTVIDGLASALEYAHQFTVHRDIKPENIMITSDGVVKLMDFGISKLMADTRMTAASVVMGTPFYMSPEQLKNSRDVDARADIYSVGVVLYEALTGNVPTGVPRPASQVSSEVPPALDTIILKCVAPDPRERYLNATELRAALRPVIELAQSGGVTLRPQQGVPQARAQQRTSVVGPGIPWAKITGVVLLAGLMAGAIYALYRVEAQRKAAVEAAAMAVAATPSSEMVAETSGGRSWEELSALVESLKQVAVQRGASGDLAAIYRKGDECWQKAQGLSDSAADSEERARMLRRAVQYYAAVLLSIEHPEMVFVPESRVDEVTGTTMLEPFFIDATEVTVDAWQRFCASSREQWPACAPELLALVGEPQMPISGLRFFEAEAFAAEQGKLLPTSAQWSAAAYAAQGRPGTFPWGDEALDDAANVDAAADSAAPVKSFSQDVTTSGIYDLVGNVAEWTRTPAGADTGKRPDFGTPMVVRGGHFRAAAMPLSDAAMMDYYAAAPTLGFRCVLEIPTDPEALRALVARQS